MIRRCVVCGAEFIMAPSSNKITCSKACSDVRRSQSYQGKRIRTNGKPSPVSTYKGWGLLAWEDQKEDTP